ncbi:GyrI-like domain-containing protein [Fodinibius halophilus]|uniref:AraC family transcriptional regulator n=1 Tax=Fodinibius halophilus TaxID=1736908 RepID=A0A6M1T6L0_9BACT|nr:GyrI-like domain-containing protein [Fodinibius halophilus]NGP89777.1 AraC family transcriptional regulator [Fodinibius halophilus]
MKLTELQEITLIGLSLPEKTTNENNQAQKDCGQLWERFQSEDCISNIPNKLGDEVFAVYHDYEGDFTQPYSYFIGCKVPAETEVPKGMDQLTIPEGKYQKITAKGEIPDCVANAWREIWEKDGELNRKYLADFEVYGSKSQDWDNAEVDIYLSTK